MSIKDCLREIWQICNATRIKLYMLTSMQPSMIEVNLWKPFIQW